MSSCVLCRRFVGSVSVTVAGTSLVVNIPDARYNDGTRLCLNVLQELPDAATINMPVVITIGADTTQFPLVRCNGTPVTASDITYRGQYKVKLQTTPSTGVFRVVSGLCCSPRNNLLSIPVPTATPTPGGG